MDLYRILGVPKAATPADIQRAYRRMARKYHPGLNPGDRAAEAYFRKVVDAYETLGNPERRRAYDAGLAPEPEAATCEFQGFDFSRAAEGAQASTFSELFADVFSGRTTRGGSRQEPEPGSDLHVRILLDFEEAIGGAARQVTLTRLVRCDSCHGSGRLRTVEMPCRHCEGSGRVRWARGHMVFSRSCPACGGSGQQRDRACPACGSEGVEVRTEAVEVRVPAGTADGDRIHVPGQGHAGRRGGIAGDLYLIAQVRPHPWFRRAGEDVYLTIPVAVHEAALGTRVTIPTLEGARTLRVPPGTQSGQRFRLRGRGAPSSRSGGRGDLIAEVQIVLPEVLDERSKDLLREFGRRNPESVRSDLEEYMASGAHQAALDEPTDTGRAS
jgi:molecular chaperone DnaJ